MQRRAFMKNILISLAGVLTHRTVGATMPKRSGPKGEPKTTVYRALNAAPDVNLNKVIDLMGGIHHAIGIEDVVAIKPNIQWWNHGVPNLLVVKALVDAIFNRQGGFDGEVVILENVHRGSEPWKHAGWSRDFDLNADLAGVRNYNDLCRLLKQTYGDRFSTVHLVNVKDGGRRVMGPEEGPGYVYCDGTGGHPLIAMDNGASGEHFRRVIMTYPIFKTDRGTLVDFKEGVWEHGGYSPRPFKFINIAGINHHSTWCGVSSTIKNYLGISDLSGGPDPHNDGKLTEEFYNFHSFPFDEWAPGPVTGMIGAEIGIFLERIRRADLNITTAEWVGLADRTKLPAANTRCVAASTDPVALDYHCAKYILYPNSRTMFHHPDDINRPTHQHIKACAEHGGGVFDESKVALVSYDHKSKRMQRDDEAVIVAQKEWGSDPKALGKYLLMRYGAFFL